MTETLALNQIRQDKYQPGDQVTFITEDMYNGSGHAERYYKRYHRPGSLTIQAVQAVEPGMLAATLHTQYVMVDGIEYSGYWFNPVR